MRPSERLLACGVLMLLLSSCSENTYGPPVPGQPMTWGQKHYLDNQKYQQLNQDRMGR